MSGNGSGSLALIHTVTGLVPTFKELVRRHLPDWRPFNIVDESLLRNAIRDGRLTEDNARRVAGHIWSAVDAGADAVLVTCSSISPAVDATRSFCPVPLVRVDEEMADEAIRLGDRIGALSEQIGLSLGGVVRSLAACAIPSATSTAHPRSSASR